MLASNRLSCICATLRYTYRVSSRLSDVHFVLKAMLCTSTNHCTPTRYVETAIHGQCKLHFHRPSSFGMMASKLLGSETSFISIWPLTSDTYTSAT